MGSLKLDTPPGALAVTLNDLKDHLRIIGNAEDQYLTSLLNAAIPIVERFLDRALITQTWLWTFDKSPGNDLRVPLPPFQTATIKVFDWDDAETTVDASTYLKITDTEPGRILLKNGATWPDHRDKASFQIKFVAGYGNADTDVPEGIKHGIKVLCGKAFERRGDDKVTTQTLQILLNDEMVQNWLHPEKFTGI